MKEIRCGMDCSCISDCLAGFNRCITRGHAPPEESLKENLRDKKDTSSSKEITIRVPDLEKDFNVTDWPKASLSYKKELGMKECKGGFAKVIFIRGKTDGKPYALKQPLSGRYEEKQRILEESKILEGLNHPHIIRKVEAVRIGNLPCLVLSRGGEEILEIILRNNSLDLATVSKVAHQGFSVLRYLQEQGITHADIKPENILYDGDDIKVIDFGISFRGDKRSSHRMGSEEYLSPEMLLKEVVGTAADVWGLAIVLFISYTGTQLFCLGEKRNVKKLPTVHEGVLEQRYPQEWQERLSDLNLQCNPSSSLKCSLPSLPIAIEMERQKKGDSVAQSLELTQGLLNMLRISPAERVLPSEEWLSSKV